MLSTEHHTNKIDSFTNKSEIILDYNRLKGGLLFHLNIIVTIRLISVHFVGVDTFDHLIAINTCRRKTNRWPLNCFMFILDSTVQNAFSLSCLIRPPRDQARSKEYRVTQLGIYLTKLNATERMSKIHKDKTGFHNNTVHSISSFLNVSAVLKEL